MNKTIEQRLKEKGITDKTKFHNYDYLYKSIVKIMQDYENELTECREQLEIYEEQLSQIYDIEEEKRNQ